MASEPYSIVDNVTNKTVRQMISLEQATAEKWKRISEGEDVRMVGRQDDTEPKRKWGE